MPQSVLGSISEWLFFGRHRGFSGGSAPGGSVPGPAEQPARPRIRIPGEFVKFAVDEDARIVPIIRSTSPDVDKLRIKGVAPRWIRLQIGVGQPGTSNGNAQPTK